jgi:hypothetical protein
MFIFRGITITTKQPVMGYLVGKNIIKPIGRNLITKVESESLEVSTQKLLDEGHDLWCPFGIAEAVMEDAFHVMNGSDSEDEGLDDNPNLDPSDFEDSDELPGIDDNNAKAN